MKKVRKEKKGFTLAELLIVVAIIGVLAAVSIPVFTTQLEKSREATDLANIRAAYAKVMVSAIDMETSGFDPLPEPVNLQQAQDGWLEGSTAPDLLDELFGGNVNGEPVGNSYAEISWDSESGNARLDYAS